VVAVISCEWYASSLREDGEVCRIEAGGKGTARQGGKDRRRGGIRSTTRFRRRRFGGVGMAKRECALLSRGPFFFLPLSPSLLGAADDECVVTGSRRSSTAGLATAAYSSGEGGPLWEWDMGSVGLARETTATDRTDRQTDRKWQTSKKIINTYRMDGGGGGYKGCGSVEKKKRAGGGLSSLCTTLGLFFSTTKDKRVPQADYGA